MPAHPCSRAADSVQEAAPSLPSGTPLAIDFRRSAPVGEEASRSFKPGVSATPAPCWRRSVEQLAALSAWATEHRFGIKRGIPARIVLVAFGRCL
jgi:hypothetical protein